jgi:hypothetical protein
MFRWWNSSSSRKMEDHDLYRVCLWFLLGVWAVGLFVFLMSRWHRYRTFLSQHIYIAPCIFSAFVWLAKYNILQYMHDWHESADRILHALTAFTGESCISISSRAVTIEAPHLIDTLTSIRTRVTGTFVEICHTVHVMQKSVDFSIATFTTIPMRKKTLCICSVKSI